MRIGYIQMTPEFGQLEKNLQVAETLIKSNSADLLVLPEFFNTGYLFTSKQEVEKFSEDAHSGYTISFLKDISAKTETAIVAGFPEVSRGLFFNSSALVMPDGTVHVYRKTHLFDREKLFFQPGNTGFQVHDVNNVKVGMMICFDWFFPESARTLALKGVQIIAHPSNLVLPHCPRAMITRSLENHVFSITANRAGYENRGEFSLKYIGHSRIVSPHGEVLASSEDEIQHVSVVEIDPAEALKKNITSRNHLLSDRRSEWYF